ncbi:MAG: DNA-directed RNA polymerase subunit omega [Peptoniphilaceae bacterium]
MIIPSFKELKEKGDSRYSLVILASKRARKIIDGSEALLETNSKKPVTIAIEEILNGSIVYGESMSDKDYDEKIEKEKNKKLELIRQKKLDDIKKIEEDEKLEASLEENA